MRDWKLPWEGGCRCGGVRFRVSRPPLVTSACHCAGCQRMTASAFSLSVAVPSEGFAVTEGEPVVGGMHGAAQHFFCPWCMSWIFTRAEGLDWFVNVRATMLDDAAWFTPFIETWTEEKLPWAATPAVQSFARFPDAAEYPRLLEAFQARGGRPAGG